MYIVQSNIVHVMDHTKFSWIIKHTNYRFHLCESWWWLGGREGGREGGRDDDVNKRIPWLKHVDHLLEIVHDAIIATCLCVSVWDHLNNLLDGTRTLSTPGDDTGVMSPTNVSTRDPFLPSVRTDCRHESVRHHLTSLRILNVTVSEALRLEDLEVLQSLRILKGCLHNDDNKNTITDLLDHSHKSTVWHYPCDHSRSTQTFSIGEYGVCLCPYGSTWISVSTRRSTYSVIPHHW